MRQWASGHSYSTKTSCSHLCCGFTLWCLCAQITMWWPKLGHSLSLRDKTLCSSQCAPSKLHAPKPASRRRSSHNPSLTLRHYATTQQDLGYKQEPVCEGTGETHKLAVPGQSLQVTAGPKLHRPVDVQAQEQVSLQNLGRRKSSGLLWHVNKLAY